MQEELALMNAIDGLNNMKVNASINCASKIKKMESGKTCNFGDGKKIWSVMLLVEKLAMLLINFCCTSDTCVLFVCTLEIYLGVTLKKFFLNL